MKILITEPYKKNGGVYSFCENIIPFLNNNNEIDVFKRGVKDNRSIKLIIIFDQIINYFIFLKKILKNKYDLIFINTSLSKSNCLRDGIYIILSKLFNNNVLLFIHGFNEKCLKNKILIQFYFFSDNIILLSDEFRIKIKNAGYKKNIYISFNPVSKEISNYFTTNIIEERKLKNPLNILFLARIEEEKGIMIALKAFEILVNKNELFHFYIAGNGSKLKDAEVYVLNNKIKNIHFLGFIKDDEKLKILKESDILLFPTYHEGLPINILEAMSSGLPIVTRPVGGIKDFFENGKMGYLINTKNPVDFAEKIETLLNSDKYLDICKYNYEYANKNFNAELITKKLEIIMKKIVYEKN